MPLARAALAVALAAWLAPAARGDDDVRFRVALRTRLVDLANRPSGELLLDRGARAFDVGQYLLPTGQDVYASVLATAAADGRHGWFRWGLAIDTGELRSASFPLLSNACFSNASPTGIDVVGSGRCNVAPGRRAVYTVEDTRLGAAQLTSNGRSFEDELGSTLLLREAWVGAAVGRNQFALLRAGRRRFTVGDGFVHDDYGLGVEAALDLGAIGPSWDVAASAFYPTRDLPSGRGWASPVVAVRVDWLPSLFEHVGAFAAYQRDRTGSAAELFRGSLAEPSVLKLQGEQPGTAAYVAEERALLAIEGSYREGDSALWWVGTSGAVVPWRRAHLSWTAALNLGHVTIALPDAPLESSGSVFGRLVHAALRAFVGDEVELGGFFLYMSGDLPPTEKARLGLAESYGGFLGVVPFITLTNIFFNGGVGATFGAQQATAPGVNGRGVIAPGVTLGWDPLAVLGVDLRAAWLLADAAGPYGGRSYGPELDAEVSWSPLRWLRLTAEGDVLFPGDFFPGSAPVTKLVLALDLVGP